MVISRKKQLLKIESSWKIELEKIIYDISVRNYKSYDKKKLKWHANLYRIRVWKYRIIFEDNIWENTKIKAIDQRWDIYKNF